MKYLIFIIFYTLAYQYDLVNGQCTYYAIKPGDSFYSISNGDASLIAALTAANPTINSANITVGQYICIPNGYSGYNLYGTSGGSGGSGTYYYTTSCASYYTIQPGDSYYSISNGNSALLSALTAANPAISSSNLAVGQAICIPSGYSGWNLYATYATSAPIVYTTTYPVIYTTALACSSYYTIKSGDSFYSISNGNSALMSALAAANPTVSSSNLAVGQAICIPSGYSGWNLYATAAPVIVTQAACASYYTIKSGDTFYGISSGSQALIAALTAANPTVSASNLAIGQQICIPSGYTGYNLGASAYAASCTYYQIKAGQTYYSIAGGSSALISQLTLANPSLNPSNLQVGQSICIPSQYYSSYLLY